MPRNETNKWKLEQGLIRFVIFGMSLACPIICMQFGPLDYSPATVMALAQNGIHRGSVLAAKLLPERRRVLELILGPLILLLIWWIADVSHLLNNNLLPSPFATLRDTWKNIISGTLPHDFLQTLVRVTYAFVAAAVLGIPAGIVLGAKESIYRSVEFIIDFFRSTPATAMFPLFMLLFGLGDFSEIAVATFAAWLVIVFNVAYGVMNARQTRILAARSMGASSLRIFKDVIFFETLPQTFVGLRTGVSLALVVIIVAEMFIGASAGLGHRIIDAQISYQLTDMYGSILAAGVMGYGLNLLFLVIEKLLIHWSGR